MMRYVLSAGILAAMMGAAEAAPKCSPGKIYRVSKKICVDKAEAIRDGVISSRAKTTKARNSVTLASLKTNKPERAPASRTNASRTDDEVTTIERTPPARDERVASQAPAPRPRPAESPERRKPAGAAGSPFGALADPWSAGLVNSDHQFSLQMTSGN